jgi:hypothetical protein
VVHRILVVEKRLEEMETLQIFARYCSYFKQAYELRQ